LHIVIYLSCDVHKLTLFQIKKQCLSNAEGFIATEDVAQADVDTVVKVKHFSDNRFDMADHQDAANTG